MCPTVPHPLLTARAVPPPTLNSAVELSLRSSSVSLGYVRARAVAGLPVGALGVLSVEAPATRGGRDADMVCVLSPVRVSSPEVVEEDGDHEEHNDDGRPLPKQQLAVQRCRLVLELLCPRRQLVGSGRHSCEQIRRILALSHSTTSKSQ